MASLLETPGIYRPDVKHFVLTHTYRLKDHARRMATREGRPYQYLGERTRKEDLARQLAANEERIHAPSARGGSGSAGGRGA